MTNKLAQCPYCKRPADEHGGINHVGGCTGLQYIPMNRLQYDILRGNLSLAEEGLANARLEIERLKRSRAQERDYLELCEEHGRMKALLRDWLIACPNPPDWHWTFDLHVRTVNTLGGIPTSAEPVQQYSRDADHCDFPDCEQHWSLVVDRALAAMTKFHATFAPDEEDADMTPRTTSKAFREFVDEHARLLRIRASAPPPLRELSATEQTERSALDARLAGRERKSINFDDIGAQHVREEGAELDDPERCAVQNEPRCQSYPDCYCGWNKMTAVKSPPQKSGNYCVVHNTMECPFCTPDTAKSLPQLPHLDTCGLKYGGQTCTCGLTEESR